VLCRGSPCYSSASVETITTVRLSAAPAARSSALSALGIAKGDRESAELMVALCVESGFVPSFDTHGASPLGRCLPAR
jgi:hypothetical protein